MLYISVTCCPTTTTNTLLAEGMCVLCVCVCVRERESAHACTCVCVHMYVCMCKRERENFVCIANTKFRSYTSNVPIML